MKKVVQKLIKRPNFRRKTQFMLHLRRMHVPKHMCYPLRCETASIKHNPLFRFWLNPIAVMHGSSKSETTAGEIVALRCVRDKAKR